MAHRRKFDVVAVTGKYTTQDGQEKSRYTNIGVVLENTDKGSFSLKLEAIPVGWDGYAYLFEPKAREERPAPKPRNDDDVPFN